MSEATIYRLIKQENIPFNRPSAGILLFNLNAIDEWLLHEDYGSIKERGQKQVSNIKWIKLSTSMFDDEKIKLIEKLPEADTILIIWIKLLSQAGRTNANGYIYLNENVPY